MAGRTEVHPTVQMAGGSGWRCAPRRRVAMRRTTRMARNFPSLEILGQVWPRMRILRRISMFPAAKYAAKYGHVWRRMGVWLDQETGHDNDPPRSSLEAQGVPPRIRLPSRHSCGALSGDCGGFDFA